MLISVTAEAGKNNEIKETLDDKPFVGREYIGSAPRLDSPDYGRNVAGGDYPQAYLVIQPPDSTLPPHFHQTNQFQVFVKGGGRLGKRRADPITVQYAGCDTPYGPIIAEEQGVAYFTLRQKWDSGAKYLPASRDMMVTGRQRQHIATALNEHEATAKVMTLIAEEADGLAAMRYRLAAGETAQIPDVQLGGGQYHVVICGSLLRQDQELGPLSVEFASSDEGKVDLVAGSRGVDVLVLRFPQTE